MLKKLGAGGLAVSLGSATAGVPQNDCAFTSLSIAAQRVEYTGYDNARKGKSFGIGYHPAQLGSGATRRGTKKSTESKAIDENQTRFLRANL